MQFTLRMRAELEDLRNEMLFCIPDEQHQQEFEQIILNQVRLFTSNSPWEDWTFSFANRLRDSWVLTVVSSIMEVGGNEWMIAQADSESFDHPLKTLVRMAEVSTVSALARIVFTSTVNLEWVHPRIKAYWYALAQSPNEDVYVDCAVCGNPQCENRDLILSAETHLTVGDRYVNLSLFDCAAPPHGA